MILQVYLLQALPEPGRPDAAPPEADDGSGHFLLWESLCLRRPHHTEHPRVLLAGEYLNYISMGDYFVNLLLDYFTQGRIFVNLENATKILLLYNFSTVYCSALQRL